MAVIVEANLQVEAVLEAVAEVAMEDLEEEVVLAAEEEVAASVALAEALAVVAEQVVDGDNNFPLDIQYIFTHNYVIF
jgi:hypothetical protein